MADLKTDYLDDILAESMGGKRKFRITKSDGSTEDVTLEDISEYTQKGSNFGAGDINNTNQEVNLKFDSGDVVDPMLATEGGFAADALATKKAVNELNSNFEWKYAGEFKSGGSINTIDGAKEYMVYLYFIDTECLCWYFSAKEYFDILVTGFYYNTANYCSAAITYTQNIIRYASNWHSLTLSGNAVASTSVTLKVYYR